MELSKSTRLSISLRDDKNMNKFLTKYIKHVLSITQVYHLDIWIYELDLKPLIRILNILPEIKSLKIRSIKCNDEMTLSDEENQMFSSVVQKNKITKIYLDEIKSIEEFGVLTTLCPLMVYFKVNEIDIKNILFYSLCILETINEKGNDQLCLLSFHFRMIDDKLVGLLQQIINDRISSIDYTVKRLLGFIYIEKK